MGDLECLSADDVAFYFSQTSPIGAQPRQHTPHSITPLPQDMLAPPSVAEMLRLTGDLNVAIAMCSTDAVPLGITGDALALSTNVATTPSSQPSAPVFKTVPYRARYEALLPILSPTLHHWLEAQRTQYDLLLRQGTSTNVGNFDQLHAILDRLVCLQHVPDDSSLDELSARFALFKQLDGSKARWTNSTLKRMTGWQTPGRHPARTYHPKFDECDVRIEHLANVAKPKSTTRRKREKAGAPGTRKRRTTGKTPTIQTLGPPVQQSTSIPSDLRSPAMQTLGPPVHQSTSTPPDLLSPLNARTTNTPSQATPVDPLIQFQLADRRRCAVAWDRSMATRVAECRRELTAANDRVSNMEACRAWALHTDPDLEMQTTTGAYSMVEFHNDCVTRAKAKVLQEEFNLRCATDMQATGSPFGDSDALFFQGLDQELL